MPSVNTGWLRRLSPHLRPYRRDFAVCIALSVLSQVPTGLLPLVQQIIVDDVVIARRRPLAPWLLALLGLGVAAFGIQYWRRYLGARNSLDLQHDLRLAIYRQLQRLDFARHEQLSPGDVMSRAAGD